jgi:thymidylate kinase
LCQLVGEKLSGEMVAAIKENDFEHLISLAPLMTRNLRHYVRKKKPLSIIGHYAYFIQKKVSIIILFYKKYAKTVAVVAPDGAGKSTFLDALIDEMNYLLINTPEDGRFHVYHFRPGILPNLGAVGEKMKLKEQDKDFTNPHRAKPAGFISSLFRALWYWFDYVLGWQKCVRNDVHYGRYTLFDRYCYDYIVDPERMRISLPLCLRKLFVATIPKPGVIFFLDADEDVIYRRKKELTKDEISSQLASYRELAKKDSRFVVLDATKEPKALAMEAAGILIDKYTLNIK